MVGIIGEGCYGVVIVPAELQPEKNKKESRRGGEGGCWLCVCLEPRPRDPPQYLSLCLTWSPVRPMLSDARVSNRRWARHVGLAWFDH